MWLYVLLCALLLTAGAVEQWVINLAAGVNPEHYARDNGFVYVGPVPFLLPTSGTYIFTRRNTTTPTRRMRAVEGVVNWGELQDRTRQRLFTRTSTADPLYASQWHLHSHTSSLDADFAGGATGRGVTIGIVDDGLQHHHPDLAANYDPHHSWDFNDNDPDPTPHDNQGHGTAAAGVAAAVANNGHCGRGVAPSAKLVGLRTIAGPVSDLTEAEALAHNAIGVVDVYSCSWGPVDNGRSMEEPGNLVMQTLALYAGGLRGRLGKGSIYVWAAGNGRANGDSCAFDGYASSIYTIPIGALDFIGNQAWYSESCAALMAVTPSSGAAEGITTVDLIGPNGYDPGECTDSFGGTSAAAPAAAAVIALMLEVRPDLTWRDVKHVIAKGAVPVRTEDRDWSRNANGYRHSHKYGFGLLKVPSILAVARTHKLLANPHYTNTYVGRPTHIEPPLSRIPINVTYAVTGSPLTFIEYVTLQVGISHWHRGYVSIELESPSGIVSLLAQERSEDDAEDYPSSGWRFVTVRHWGETIVNGPWRIRAHESAALPPSQRGRGLLNGYQLTIYGY
jgi:kexin